MQGRFLCPWRACVRLRAFANVRLRGRMPGRWGGRQQWDLLATKRFAHHSARLSRAEAAALLRERAEGRDAL